ncbi:MAG: class I SAM-dependent methyltransferase [Candidatus Altiarchaeota archaeon]|nr:class I SAM-dependent methyltransferase [Candidatus Altiarchaeota archaeon]
MGKISKLYNLFLRLFIKKSFPIWQRIGFHITRNHFYEPVPDTRTLKDDLWQKQSELIGIDMNEEGQINLLSKFSSKFKEEYESFPRNKTSVPYQYYVNNGAFESVDGEILHCMIRCFKPRKIFEIGSGNSTYLSAQAVLKNREDDGHECELISIEPYPNDVLKAGFPGLSKLMTNKIQDIPLSKFNELKENDILFIDSSHVLKTGGDIQYEYLEILPRLNKGVIIHVHDIFLPAEYHKKWVLQDYRFYTEQYLLHAFLTFNSVFEVLLGGSYMHLKHPEKLEATFSSYKREERWPGSFWMRKKI